MRNSRATDDNDGFDHRHPLKSESPPFFFAPAEAPGVPLRLYLRIIWNRRWIILAMTILLLVVVGIQTIRQKPLYKAKGTLQIEMPKQGVTAIQDFFPTANVPDSYLQTQAKILGSGKLANEVMNKLNSPSSRKQESVASRWNDEVSFHKHLEIEVIKGSQLIQVGFESDDPALASRVVNQLMELYLDQIQEERSDTALGASGWLMDQLKETKAKLDESMDALHRYEHEHQLLQLDPNREKLMNIDADRLQQLQQKLETVEGARMEKETIYKRVLGGDTLALHSDLLEENLKKEADLKTQLAQLNERYGPKFPQVQRAQTELSEVRAVLAAERDRLSKEIEAEYTGITEEEDLIRKEMADQENKVSSGSDQMMQDNILKRDVDLNEQAYESLLQKIQEATNTANLKTVNARIVDPAETPAVSGHPALARNLVLSLMLGLIGGIGFAIAEEFLRDTIKTAGEAESDLDLPLLGVVPAVASRTIDDASHKNGNGSRPFRQVIKANGKLKQGESIRMDKAGPGYYDLSEAIRNLRTSLLFALGAKAPHSILFSSTLPSEGKTTLCSNLSISLTQLGKKVLMVDGDLRRPCLHRVFSIPERRGLTEYLQGICDWDEVIQRSDVPGLDVIVCGKRPQNPAELLSSDRMREVIARAKSHYDVVMVDSPTLLNMADSRILASYVDGVVIVVKSRATPKLLAKQACANARGANATIIGVVLNHLEAGDSEYSYSYYGYPKPPDSGDHDKQHVSIS